MILEARPYKDYLVVELKLKEANLVEAERFKSEMVQLINQGHKEIVVDFEQVSYVDSSFLGALVSSLKYAISKDGDIAVSRLNKDILDLFQLIRMDKVFKIYSNLPESYGEK